MPPFRVPDFLTNLLRGLAGSRGRPRFVHRDHNGSDRGGIHASEGNEFAPAVGDGDYYRLLHLKRFFHNEVDGSLRLRVVKGGNHFHRQQPYHGARRAAIGARPSLQSVVSVARATSLVPVEEWPAAPMSGERNAFALPPAA